MDKRTEMIAGAVRIFDAEGFRGIGIDRLIAPSGVSTRTLDKHSGSRDGRVSAVLEARHRAFMNLLEADDGSAEPVGALFDALGAWIQTHPAHGCLLLRARSEYASACEAIVSLVHQQKEESRAEIARRVHVALGQDDAQLATQVWLLFEGATAAASVVKASVIDDARDAALALLAHARERQ